MKLNSTAQDKETAERRNKRNYKIVEIQITRLLLRRKYVSK